MQSKYLLNYSYLKYYGKGKYKLVTLFCKRNSDVNWSYSAKGSVNCDKLENNLARAKAKLFEYAYCNDWEYMITCTIDGSKHDRFDLGSYHKSFAQMIRDSNKRASPKISYMLVPEKHQDGAWHEHGLMSHIPPDELLQLDTSMHLPYGLISRLEAGEQLYIWTKYEARYGYCVLSRIRSFEGVSRYITKYLTKDTQRNVSQLGAHMYYCSQGLDSALTIKQGTMSANIVPDYKSDYAAVKWFEGVSDPEALVLSLFKE